MWRYDDLNIVVLKSIAIVDSARIIIVMGAFALKSTFVVDRRRRRSLGYRTKQSAMAALKKASFGAKRVRSLTLF